MQQTTGIEAIPDDVMWEEGMLLAPQHFQQASIRTEALVHYHVRAARPWHWGVRSLSVEVHTEGVFRVDELEAVMPDGLPVRHTRGRLQALERNVRAEAEKARPAPLTLWLCVPARRPAEDPWEGSIPRYDPLEAVEVVDENDGRGKAPVRRLRPRLTLIAGDRPSGAYVSFPIARVTVTDDKLAPTDYVPPQLCARAGAYPWDDCRELARRVRRKAEVLARRGDASERTETQVRALAAGLPQLEAVTAVEGVHPLDLYLALCAMAGSLAGATARTVPGPFPAYDHDDLRATFGPVLSFCDTMVSRVSETHVPVPFLPEADGFALVIREEWLREPPLVVGVLAQGGGTEADAAEWLDECRIGSAGRMESMRVRRVTGAARARIRDTSKVGFLPAQGEVLFSIDCDPEFVDAGEPLVVQNPRDPSGRRRPRALVLYTRNT
jgi:type VI secretion system protein ImpJ